LSAVNAVDFIVPQHGSRAGEGHWNSEAGDWSDGKVQSSKHPANTRSYTTRLPFLCVCRVDAR